MAGLDLLHEHSILTAVPTLQSKGLFAQQLSISPHSALLSYSCLPFGEGWVLSGYPIKQLLVCQQIVSYLLTVMASSHKIVSSDTQATPTRMLSALMLNLQSARSSGCQRKDWRQQSEVRL